MTAVALALVLAAAPARQASPPPDAHWEVEELTEEEVAEHEAELAEAAAEAAWWAEQAEEEKPPKYPRRFRMGARSSRLFDAPGYASGGELGLEINYRSWFGLRLDVSTALRQDWGAVTFAPEAAFYPLPRSSISPYVALGLQLGIVNLTGAERRTRAARGGLSVEKSALGGTEIDAGFAGAGFGPVPLEFSIGPQATAGALLWLEPNVALDVGLRYELMRWRGEGYGGLGVVVAIVGPM
jgi:hypothetical protein